MQFFGLTRWLSFWCPHRKTLPNLALTLLKVKLRQGTTIWTDLIAGTKEIFECFIEEHENPRECRAA
jgi:hypothetical protein